MQAAGSFAVLPIDVLTCDLPRILWVELTSKCPFDCIFCSRKTLRGAGEHMDFELYKSIIGSLDRPETVRLNYSGESTHYPQLIEAIELAHESGAFVELVTAFSSFPLHKMASLVTSGLDRLTVSLHTLDDEQFQRLYRYSSLVEMKTRLAALCEARQRLGRAKPFLDFAFVALRENVEQLRSVAAYARTLAVTKIGIHPVIRRDEIPVHFPAEIEGRSLRPDFIRTLQQELESVRSDFPDVQFNPSTCELAPGHALHSIPQYTARPLAPGERIFSCSQSPWDSMHILANGDVVTCEVRDRVVMGNLSAKSLPEIWRGEEYLQFRRRYQEGRDEACRTCTYKLAYVPGPLRSAVRPAEGNGVELANGWYGSEGAVVWSKRLSRALIALDLDSNGHSLGVTHPYLEIYGMLPAGNGTANELIIKHRGLRIGSVENSSDSIQSFRLRMPFDEPERAAQFDFVVGQPCRPADKGFPDIRELGFALGGMRVASAKQAQRWRFVPLYLALELGLRLAPVLARIRTKTRCLPAWRPGISIVIPERATPGPLECSLASALDAAARLDEEYEIIVVVNGAPLDNYARLRERFRGVRWLRSEDPLGFSGAVHWGVREARFDWVYLLNSDMTLAPQALGEVARWRATRVFAIASQVFFADLNRRREETGCTDFRTKDGMVEIFNVPPAAERNVRGHFYASGGASLFRRRLLQQLMARSHPYNPVYWEDAEWGLRAWRAGYEVLFCPTSRATHLHRATVCQVFSQEEVDRILRRNQLLFSLRNGFLRIRPRALVQDLLRSWDCTTQRELSAPRQVISLLRATLWNALAPAGTIDLDRLRRESYLRPPWPENR